MARVVKAQWENECILLSVLSVSRVSIAQWKNDCISLSVLPVARVIIAQCENECICENSNNTSQQQLATTACNQLQLGGLAPLLYRYVEVSPNKIANHDKRNNYFTNRLQDTFVP